MISMVNTPAYMPCCTKIRLKHISSRYYYRMSSKKASIFIPPTEHICHMFDSINFILIVDSISMNMYFMQGRDKRLSLHSFNTRFCMREEHAWCWCIYIVCHRPKMIAMTKSPSSYNYLLSCDAHGDICHYTIDEKIMRYYNFGEFHFYW